MKHMENETVLSDLTWFKTIQTNKETWWARSPPAPERGQVTALKMQQWESGMSVLWHKGISVIAVGFACKGLIATVLIVFAVSLIILNLHD